MDFNLTSPCLTWVVGQRRCLDVARDPMCRHYNTHASSVWHSICAFQCFDAAQDESTSWTVDPGDEGPTIPRNVGSLSPKDTVPHPAELISWATHCDAGGLQCGVPVSRTVDTSQNNTCVWNTDALPTANSKHLMYGLRLTWVTYTVLSNCLPLGLGDMLIQFVLSQNKDTFPGTRWIRRTAQPSPTLV